LNQALNEPTKATAPLEPAASAPPAAAPAVTAGPDTVVKVTPEPVKEDEPDLVLDDEPEPFVIEPPAAFEPLAASSNAATLDDYFDRLSAAFEQGTGPSPRPYAGAADRFESLAPQAPAAPAPSRPADEWPAQEWLSPGTAPVRFEPRADDANPILEAVTALLAPAADGAPTATAASQLWRDAPATPAVAAPSDRWVSEVTERVLARLVPEVTESLRRLVQQEVARANRDVH
jgi:hypothetical protein